jgi:adenylyltransferase/sulfurtransferase
MPGLKNDDLPKCGVVGVHPSSLAMVTAVQVFEAVRILVGKDPKLLNKLLFIDLEDMRFHVVNMSSSRNCPVCGRTPDGLPAPIEDNLFEETCARDGRRNFIINPNERIEVNMEDLRDVLSKRGLAIKTSGRFGITFALSDHVFASILKSGIMIMQTAPHVNGYPRSEVMQLYKSILVDGLSLPRSILPQNR